MRKHLLTRSVLACLAAILLALGGCNLVYKQNIQQGNALDQEDLDKLRLGMSMNQVSFLLGTPSVQDPFHHDRWDYVSSFSRRGDEPVARKVTLYFEDGSLAEMIGVESDEFIFEEESTPQPARKSADTNVDTADSEPEVTPLAAPVAEEVTYSPEQPGTPVNDLGTQTIASSAEPETANSDEPGSIDAYGDNQLVADDGMEPPESAIEPQPLQTETEVWEIQFGAFDVEDNADDMAQRLRAAGYEAFIVPQETNDGRWRYLVRYSLNGNQAAADATRSTILDQLGINGFVIPPGG